MKRSSLPLNTRCEQQLTDTRALNASLQQTVMQLQEALIISNELHVKKDQLISTQDQQIGTLITEGQLKDGTITSLNELNDQQEVIMGKQNTIIEQQLQRLRKNKANLFDYKILRYQWMQLRKMMWGRKSEKRFMTVMPENKNNGVQQVLFEVPADHDGITHLKDAKRIKERMVVVVNNKADAPHPGRHELPEHLERRIVKIEQEVPKGATKVGVQRTERLACRMFEVWVNVEERDIYMIKADDSGKYKQLIAPPLPHPIPKCKADITLLVMLLIEKYLYHLPLYRIQQRFKQYGIDLKYNTLSHWVSSTIDVLRPLWELLWQELISSRYIHMDETKYRVLDNSKAKGKKSHNGYLWVAGNPILKLVCFIYKKGRGKAEVKDILTGFKGNLLTDAYGVYDGYGAQPGVVHSHCMDHARRYFSDALLNDEQRSAYALDHFFAPLYQIERHCKEHQLSFDEITQVRQQQSVPVLNELFDWITLEITRVIKGTPIYTAMAYALKRRKQLMEYTRDGMISISNMFIEQSIRPTKVGLKNYLFAGSHEHAQRAAIIYSLIHTCKLHQVDPSEYLYDVLLRINDHKQNKLSELLPQNWKPKYHSRASVSITA